MDLGRAFSFVFDDPDWIKKIGLAALVSIIPVIGYLFILGWMLEVTRRVIFNQANPLPDLDFGENLTRGLRAFIVGVIYSLPVIVFLIIFGLSMQMGGLNENGDFTTLGVISLGCFTLFAIFYSLLLALMMPAAFAIMAARGSISASINPGEVRRLIAAAPGAYLLAVVGTLITGFISSLGSIICVIGVVITMTYALAVNGHLYGQAYREATNKPGGQFVTRQPWL